MKVSIDDLLQYALDSEASDLHLSVGNIPMLRIHGEMQKLDLPRMDKKAMDSIKNEVLNTNQ